MNNARAGWRKFALHFFGFGVPVGLVVWFGGWSGAAVLFAWRGREEYLDWHEHLDTSGKAVIDLFSQTALPITIAIFRSLHK